MLRIFEEFLFELCFVGQLSSHDLQSWCLVSRLRLWLPAILSSRGPGYIGNLVLPTQEHHEVVVSFPIAFGAMIYESMNLYLWMIWLLWSCSGMRWYELWWEFRYEKTLNECVGPDPCDVFVTFWNAQEDGHVWKRSCYILSRFWNVTDTLHLRFWDAGKTILTQ